MSNFLNNSIYRIGGAAKYLGSSKNTVRKWTDCGLIKSKRTPSGHRIYRQEWLDEFIESLRDGAFSGEPVGRHRGRRIELQGESDLSVHPDEKGGNHGC